MLTGFAAGDIALIVVNPSLLSNTPYPWTNYTVEAKGRVPTANTGVARDLSVVVRYAGTGNFYWMGLGLYNYKWGIGRAVNGVYEHVSNSLSGTVDPTAPPYTDVVLGQTYTVKAVANGTVLELWVDGVKVCVYDTANDTTKHANGSIGFRNYDTMVEWDYIDAQPYGVTPPIPWLEVGLGLLGVGTAIYVVRKF